MSFKNSKYVTRVFTKFVKINIGYSIFCKSCGLCVNYLVT